MIKKIISTYKREGLIGFFIFCSNRFSIKRKMISVILSPIAIPTALGILAISPWVRIRVVMLFSNLIGHYAWNTEFWLCTLDLGADQNKNIKTLFYTVPGYPICNPQLHTMWKRVITVVPFPYIMHEVDKYLMKWSSRYRNDAFKKFFRPQAWDVWNLLGKMKKPHIAFSPAEEKKGQELLKALGIPPNARYVCLLGRDPLYLKKHMPNRDFSYMNYRNVKINSYKKAAEFLVDNDCYVIRMGKHVEEKFDMDHPRVIDYANSPLRSDFGDIYLSANCFFFISMGSGLDAIPYIFKRPLVLTNLPGFDCSFHFNWDLVIFKKLFDMKNKRFLTLKEIADTFPYTETDRGRLILKIAEKKGLCFVDNSPDEITDVVKEMYYRLNNKWVFDEHDEYLQQKYWKHFKDPNVVALSAPPPALKMPNLKVPVFEAANLDFNRKVGSVRLRMGTDFLKNNQSWIFVNEQSESTTQSIPS